MFVIYVEVIMYLLLYNFYDCTLNPLLRIVVPEQHLLFCYLLESQKSYSEKVNCFGNAERWSLKNTHNLFPVALHGKGPCSSNF